jgi:hypothetical protein
VRREEREEILKGDVRNKKREERRDKREGRR